VSYTNSKSKGTPANARRYFFCLVQLKRDSSTNEFQFTA
jgi:hypothetical protein